MIKSRGENKQGRNPFDLTNRHVYTSKVGKITPVKALHTYPDDYFEVELSEFSQNNIPMNTAAFLSGKKEMLAYFVPYNSIWHNFNQYQATREDPESTLLKEKGISFEPRMTLQSLYMAALHFANVKFLYSDYIDILILRNLVRGFTVNSTFSYIALNIAVGDSGAEILQRAKETLIADTNQSWYEACYNFTLAFIKDEYTFDKFSGSSASDYYFGLEFDCYESAVLHEPNLTLYDTGTNMQGNFIWCDWLQKLDMLGYSNIYPILSEYLSDMRKKLDWILENSNMEIFSSLTPLNAQLIVNSDNDDNLISNNYNPLQTLSTPHFDDIVTDYVSRLKDICTYKDSDNNELDEYVNVYAIYAYNKCFYDYMRNMYFDLDYSVYNYNCDFINGNSLEGSIISQAYLPLRWYHIETHQWKKDMFTGVLPDNQFGQVSELFLNTSSVTSQSELNGYAHTASYNNDVDNNYSVGASVNAGVLNLDDVYGAPDTGVLYVDNDSIDNNVQIRTPHTHALDGYVDVNIPSVTAALNVIALKRAEAIQQYRQDLMRAGNRTKDIFAQIYGSSPKSQLDECPYFIDVASNDINVNPIISTAQTGQELNGKLGDIAARSTISGGSLNFKFSTKDFGVIIFMSYIIPESFYNSYRLDPMNLHLDQESHGLPYFQNLGLQPILGEYLSNMHTHSVRTRTHGFAPPYIEFKTDIDQVHGNLVDLAMQSDVNTFDVDYQGSMSHWVVARTDMQGEQAISLRNFYINPRIVDNVFTFNAGDDYETDHFLTYCNIKVNAVRAFSEIGLPRF